MTTLYRPVKITSAEQAAALPEGTIITHAENYPQEKFAGLWGREGNSSESLAEEEGWTALVPIEAEEEFTAELRYPGKEQAHLSQPATRDHAAWQHTAFPKLSTGNTYARLVTPWEES